MKSLFLERSPVRFCFSTASALTICVAVGAAGSPPFLAEQAPGAPVDGFIARVHQGTRYRLHVPPSYNKNQKYPLVLWLHGAGGGGTDNLAQISGDQVSGTRVWTTARNQEDHPTFVLVPQVRGASWDGLIEGPNSALIQLLDSVSSEFSIDATRVYAAGQSMGGRGVWDLVRSEPDRFAAAIILCPELRSFGRVDRLGKLPVWVFDGGKDGPTFQEMSQSIVAALRAAGGVPRLTIYPDLGHEIWTRVFQEPELVPWLFAQRRR